MAEDVSRQNAVPVFSTNDEMEARMVQELLRTNGIESAINSESAPGLFPVNMGDLANQDVLVLESEVERASRIIAEEHEARGEWGGSADAADDAQRTKMIFEQIPAGGDRNFAYLIGDEAGREAAIIDASYAPERALEAANSRDLRVRYVISTHTHKDHIAGNPYILERTQAVEVMHEIAPLGGRAAAAPALLRVRDNDELSLGSLTLRFLHTPGHIPDHVCVLCGGALLTGDILFVGKIGGTGPNFPASDPAQQWESLQRLMQLDPAIEVWPGHDYGAARSSTIGREMASNPFLLCKSFDEFIDLKEHWAEYKKLHNIS